MEAALAGKSTFPPVDQDLFADAERHAGQLLGHLEEVYAALDMPESSGPGGWVLPEPFAAIFHRSGYAQGLYLKTQGFLSADLQEFVRSLAYTFEVEARFASDLRLPFVGGEVMLERKTLNPFREAAWEAYHGGLLSAYALRSMAFEKVRVSTSSEFDTTLRLVDAPESAVSPRPPLLEKRLSGIIFLAQELLEDPALSPAMREKLNLLRLAASEATKLY
jgi:hypothetical protein